MRITAIRNYESARAVSGKKQKIQSAPMRAQDTVTKQDAVSFKAHETAKGIGIGALVGIGALTILSGGAATPLAYGIYAAANGIAGGLLGNAIEETRNGNNDDE